MEKDFRDVTSACDDDKIGAHKVVTGSQEDLKEDRKVSWAERLFKEEDFTQLGGRGTKAGRHSGPHLARSLYRWAEYHQRQFSQRILQQRLGAFDMGIFNGMKLQAGSNTREYREFLRILDATGIQPPRNELRIAIGMLDRRSALV